MKRAIVFAAAVAGAQMTFGATGFKNQFKDAFWDDPANAWQTTGGGAVTTTPGQDGAIGDTIDLYTTTTMATNTLTLRTDVTAKIKMVNLYPQVTWNLNKSVFVFDGKDHTLLVPSSVEAAYASGFQMAAKGPYGGQNFFAFEDRSNSATDGNATTSAVFRADNALFRMQGLGKKVTLECLRGTFDHYSPEGVPASSGRFLNWGGGTPTVGGDNDGTIAWTLRGDDTTWIERSLYLKANFSSNVITVADGALLDIRGNINNQHSISYPNSVQVLSITNGGEVKAAPFNYGTAFSAATFSACLHRLLMDGGTVTSSGELAMRGILDIQAKDSRFNCGASNFTLGGLNTLVTQDVAMVDCAISAANVRIGDNRALASRTRGAFTNTTFTMTGSLQACGDLDFVGSHFGNPANTDQRNCLGNGKIRLENVTNEGKVMLLAGDSDEGIASGTGGYSLLSDISVVDSDLTHCRLYVGANFPTRLAVTNSSISLVYNDYMHDRFVHLCPTKVGTSDRVGKDATLILGAGAVLNAGCISRDACRSGSTAKAAVLMDGGTWNMTGVLDYRSPAAVTGIDSFKVGPSGATFALGTEGVRTIRQAIGESVVGEGRVVKTGIGTLVIADEDYAVAETVVSNGILRIDAPASFDTAVSVTAGGTFSLANGKTDALDLTGLSIDGGKLELDPDDTITVKGEIDFNNLSIVFSSAPTLDAANDVLTVVGARNPVAEAKWAQAFCASAFGDATYAKFEAVYDEGSGTTTFRVTRKNESGPIPAENDKVWSGSGAWSGAGNWTPNGVPGAEGRAVFSNPSAGAEVTVAAGDKAGAIAFRTDEKSFTVAGGELLVAGDQGAAEIAAEAGSHEIAAPMTFPVAVNVKVEPDAELALSGDITGGALRKSGNGALTISGDNAFNGGVTLAGGRTTVVNEGSLKSVTGGVANNVTLTDGTLVFDGSSTTPFDSSFTAAGSASGKFAIISNAVDMDVQEWNATGGGIVKLGGGTLTVRAAKTHETYLTRNSMGLAQSDNQYGGWATLPADGTTEGMPTNSLWALNVEEGELCLKGEPGGLFNKFHVGKVRVGTCIEGLKEQPTLTVDGVTLTVETQAAGQGNNHTGLGCYCAPNATHDFALTNCKIRVVNGGTYDGNTVYVGSGTQSSHGVYPEIYLSNGVFKSAAAFGIGYAYSADSCMMIRASDGSQLLGRDCSFGGHTFGEFDASRFECTLFSNPTFSKISISGTSWGELAFRNGSSVKFMAIAASAAATDKNIPSDAWFTMTWDDSEWDRVNATNWVFDASNASGRLRMKMEGKGMKVKVLPDNVFETKNVPFVGEGGMVLYGGGSLKFGAGMYQFTGPCEIQEGVVDLSAAGTVENACFTGPGTVSGGNLARARIYAPAGDDWSVSAAMPTFANCTYSGKITIDLGHNESNPLVLPADPQPIVVGHYTGTAPSAFRVTGTGSKDVSGLVTAKDGDILLTPSPAPGLLLIVR